MDLDSQRARRTEDVCSVITPRLWRLHAPDGVEILDADGMAAFIRVNEFDFKTVTLLNDLAPGAQFIGGGGAQPLWSVRRLTDVETHNAIVWVAWGLGLFTTTGKSDAELLTCE